MLLQPGEIRMNEWTREVNSFLQEQGGCHDYCASSHLYACTHIGRCMYLGHALAYLDYSGVGMRMEGCKGLGKVEAYSRVVVGRSVAGQCKRKRETKY
jgi:hypothetical protein